jgi:protein kinase-like protein
VGAGDLDDGNVPAPREADPWLGEVVNGRYAVERELGWGSLGRVFLVRDLLAGPEASPLALKAVRRDRHTDQAERYLRHEYRCLSGLDHPHIVAGHAFDRDRETSGEGRGLPFFTLDAVEGETLVAYVQRVGLQDAPRVLAEALRSLAYLHQRGWLHLDLKPHNVLVDSTGSVRLIDLHLSRRRGQPGLGTMRGTIAYMSPEVIRGREADPRADLYGLGAVAYEALCGSAPFAEAGDPMAVLRGHASRAPLSFAAREAEVPERLEDWVRCLLAKSPDERHPDAHEALRALAVASELELPLETEATRQAYLRGGPLVERSEERRLVLDAAEELRNGRRPAAILVTGEAGSGRTRLLDWLAPRLEVDGVRPLRLEGEAGLAQALPELLRRHALSELCPEGALDLEALLDPARGGVAAPEDLPLQVRQAHAATEVVGQLARAEHLALLVGDLSELDVLSRTVVEELLRSEAPLLVVACATEGRETPELPGAERHRLRHLTRPGAAELIAGLVGREDEAPPEELVERLWELTAGNPRHLGEVVRGLSQDGALVDSEGRLVLEVDDLERVLSTADLGALAADRVARLDPASRQVLLALAICPSPRSPVFLQALANLRPDLARTAVADLLQRGFLREVVGGTLALDHAPLAAAVRATEPDQVRDLHRRALQLLESRHPATVALAGARAAGAGDRAEELLWHAEAAGEAKRAWASARAAGRAAASAGDHPRAVSAYRRGLAQGSEAGADEGARREVVAGLAVSLGASGARAEALELLASAGSGLVPWALGLRIRARLRKDQGHVKEALQDLAAARQAAERSAGLGEEEGLCEGIAALSEEASVKLWCGEYARARELGEQALSELRRRWPGVLAGPEEGSEGAAPQQESLRRRLEVAAAEACDALHHACHFQGLDEEATAYLQEALGIKSSSDMGKVGEPTPAEAQAVLKRAIRHGRGPLLGDAAGAQVARSPIEAAFERADRSDDLLRLRQRRSRLLEAAGDLDGAAFALLNLGHLHRAKARLSDADELYRRGRALFERGECHKGESLVDLSRARLMAQLGQAGEAKELAARARSSSAALGLRWVEGLARLAQAEAAFAGRDLAGAAAAAEETQALVSELVNRPQQAELDLFLAELHLEGGSLESASEALKRFEAAPPGSRSLSLRLRAELAALRLPGDELEARGEAALAEAEARGHLELAWRLAWRRAQLRRARDYQEGELEDTISALNLLRRISDRLEPDWRAPYLADPERAAVAARFQELRS